MNDHALSRHGFDDVLPRTSWLVQDPDRRAGRADDFIVRADKSVWRRTTATDRWAPAGRLNDHIDGLVCVLIPAPIEDDDEGPHRALSVALDDGSATTFRRNSSTPHTAL